MSAAWMRHLSFGVMMAATMAACGAEETTSGPAPDPAESEAPLSNLDAILEGTPDPDKLPDEPKSDQIMPAQFDLRATQSSVKSQGSRGVCSIFSTVALMEHLYIKEGTITEPDFSEQFLQWSTKVELGAFRNTGGSSAGRNLDAINRYGVVDEATLPYESKPWTAANNPDCGKDEAERPVECHTNGTPDQEIVDNGRRWFLPRSRWVSSRVNNIKAYMLNNELAVVAGMTFFYQSWNHRRSQLPTNRTYWSEGYVLYPNAKDKEISLEKRAGHSILLVGWDDELEVPMVDEEGEQILDAEGNPQMEKGFFLFKNSWGTSGFGINNPFGAGYGWLSYRYVSEYARVVGADIPELDLKEDCSNGIDDDFDGLADCADDACGADFACRVPAQQIGGENTDAVAIPDNTPAGITSTIKLEGEGVVSELAVELFIEHSYIGDLHVTLTSPDGIEVLLHSRDGGSSRNLEETYVPSGINGATINGDWVLGVSDLAGSDVGRLVKWSLLVIPGEAGAEEICDDGMDNTGNGLVDCADPVCAAAEVCDVTGEPSLIEVSSEQAIDVPDRDLAGVNSTIDVAESGVISELSVTVDISHSYRGDLKLTLVHPDGTEVVLKENDNDNSADVNETYTVLDFNGKLSDGTWSLEVVDTARGDEGTLNGWDMAIKINQ
ncbi:MAG: proprotein convertase P-domain-containing protein [Bradymonadia bacterium]